MKADKLPSAAVVTAQGLVNPAFEQDLRILLKSGQSLIAIHGCQEMYRAQTAIQAVAASMAGKDAWTVYVWNPCRGFTWSALGPDGQMAPIPFIKPKTEDQYLDPTMALKAIPDIPRGTPYTKRAIFIFQNLHLHLQNLVALRDLLQVLVEEGKLASGTEPNEYKRPIILIHQAESLHPEIRSFAVPLRFPPANEHDLAHAIDYVGGSTSGGQKPCPEDLKRRMALSMLGLTRQQAEDVTAKCLTALKDWGEDMLTLIEEAKAAQIGQEGYLSYVPRKVLPNLGDIGGWDLAEEFVRRQCQGYTPQGRGMKLKIPRGVLLLGLPGTGKSLFAKVVTRVIYETTGQVFPTYKLNYDALFGGIVGETEANVRRLLDILYAQRRYILIVDEMEKFLGTSTTENDGGVSRKASAKFLDWLSERANRTEDDADYGYIIGTMNTLQGLEPEFLRRFNATFFVDLPAEDVRLDILKIQLRLNHAPPEAIVGQDGGALTPADWDRLAATTDEFSGSEIEQAVTLAREYAAASHGVDIREIPLEQVSPELARPTFEQLQQAVATTAKSVMAKVHGERIKTIREWCRDRALPVHITPNRTLAALKNTRRGSRPVDTGN